MDWLYLRVLKLWKQITRNVCDSVPVSEEDPLIVVSAPSQVRVV
jgi:hypothetical protein